LKAVVLAGGEGRRLRPYTYNRPKVMLPVANKPIIEYVIDALRESGIKDIYLVIGYRGETIQDYFRDGGDFGVRIYYLVQSHQLGTAHALNTAKKVIGDEYFLVLNGDNIIDSQTIRTLLEEAGEETALLTVTYTGGKEYGIIEEEGGRVKDIKEKIVGEEENLINTGIYILPPTIFDYIQKTPLSERGEYELTATIKLMIQNDEVVRAVHAEGLWADAIYPWDLIPLNERILSQQEKMVEAQVEDRVTLLGDVVVGEGTRIRSGSYLVGPIRIGRNCDIGPNVVIFPSTTIGDDCIIHPFSLIENTIVMNGSRIGSHVVLEDAVVGFDSHIGDGVRINKGWRERIVEGEVVDVEMGAAIGDQTSLGANTVVAKGVIIGNRVKISPNKTILEDVESESQVV